MAKVYNVYIDAGHGKDDPGAVGYVVERDVNLVQALACEDYLNAHGVETKLSRRNNSTGTDINKMAAEANAWGADIVLSLHNNAGKGDGAEFYYSVVGGTSKKLAKNLEAEIKKIGQNSRGCKTKKGSDGSDYFGIIRLTVAPCVLCEGFFVDNATDVKIADTKAEQQAFGHAYARGVLKTLGIKDKGLNGGKAATTSTTKKTTAAEPYLVKVEIEDLYIRRGPGTTYKKLGFIPPGTYTIVETKGKWGRLKAGPEKGKSWICLDYVKKL